jgi:hypothetical protein
MMKSSQSALTEYVALITEIGHLVVVLGRKQTYWVRQLLCLANPLSPSHNNNSGEALWMSTANHPPPCCAASRSHKYIGWFAVANDFRFRFRFRRPIKGSSRPLSEVVADGMVSMVDVMIRQTEVRSGGW